VRLACLRNCASICESWIASLTSHLASGLAEPPQGSGGVIVDLAALPPDAVRIAVFGIAELGDEFFGAGGVEEVEDEDGAGQYEPVQGVVGTAEHDHGGRG
jgi:hypothetical protein